LSAPSCPVFRIRRERDDLWIVHRPHGVVPHGFPTAHAAIVFARREIRRADAPAWIQVLIGESDFSGYYDPDKPQAVFGLSDRSK
jgi:hypothetical protein